MKEYLVNRFWHYASIPSSLNYSKDAEDECWEWQGSLHEGYGLLVTNPDSRILAHRFAYELFYGSAEGLDVHHDCQNRPCVNPKHLKALTRGEHVSLHDNLEHPMSKRTHCINGHPLFGDNLFYYNGGRRCRQCNREQRRQYVMKNLEKVRASARNREWLKGALDPLY